MCRVRHRKLTPLTQSVSIIERYASLRRLRIDGYRHRGPCGTISRCRSPPRPGQHHVVIPAAAPGTDEPIAPIQHRDAGAVALSELGRVGLDLVPAGLAPNDDADARG